MTIESIAAAFDLTCTGWQAVGDGVVLTVVHGNQIELELSLPWYAKPRLSYYPNEFGSLHKIKARIDVAIGNVCPSPRWATV